MEKTSIAEIKQMLGQIKEENNPLFLGILQDERKGVQKLIHTWRKMNEQEKRLQEKFDEMNTYENKWRAKGYEMIAGIDEVGRGPLAGPVVAAAVILPESFFLPGIDDSKKLSEKKREEFKNIICKEALAVSVAFIHAEEIDRINIYESTKKAMLLAIANLKPSPDFLLIDAMRLDTPFGFEAIIKGDAKSVSIAAASIVAKVARDNFMKEVAKTYPHYRFEQNMGYGTKDHIEAIEVYGITSFHRKSFAPIKDFL